MSKSKIISELQAGPFLFTAIKYPGEGITFTIRDSEVVIAMPQDMATFFCGAVEAVLKREKNDG